MRFGGFEPAGVLGVLILATTSCGSAAAVHNDAGPSGDAAAKTEAGTETGATGGASGSAGTSDASLDVGSGGASGSAGQLDASSDGSPGAPDVPTDSVVGPSCDLTKPFGAPILVDGVNTTSDDSVIVLAADQLTAYLESSRPGGLGGSDLWKATRALVTAPFGTPTLLEGVNSAANEVLPFISPDGLQLFFASNTSGGGDYDVRLATRTSTIAVFSASSVVAGVNTSGLEAGQWLSNDGKQLYFFSDRIGGLGGVDIWVADFGSGGASNVRNLSGVNSATDEENPVLTADGLTIYFSSKNTAGSTPATAYDIWMAHRSTAQDGFGQPKNITELNSSGGDAPTWVAPDGCTLYFSSDRAAGTAGRVGGDLYQATRGK
jgi:hypothetical protein